MAEVVAEAASDPLALFCKEFISSNPQTLPISEDALARAFISRFPVSPILMRDGVEGLCATLSIDVTYRQLPSDISGFNGCYGEKREIILSEIENPLGISTHTLFHEIREIIERVFISLGHPTIPEGEKEKRPEEFAIAVRLNSTLKGSEFLFEGAFNISSGLLRWGSIVFLAIMLMIAGAACTFLPQIEKMSERN